MSTTKIPSLEVIRKEVEPIASDWNGEDDRYISNGLEYTEEDAHIAMEILEKLDELEELIKSLTGF